MNCFQHIPESRGAIAQPPRGGATKKKADPTTQHALIGFKHPHLPQPSALHNRTCPCPLTSDRTRNARAPTSPRSIGFCAIWDCISSSSSSNPSHEPNFIWILDLRPETRTQKGPSARESIFFEISFFGNFFFLVYDQRSFYSWPHTPNPWGHVELVQKTRGLGSGNWVRPRSAKSGEGVDTFGNS